jgi:hypothetical protein
MPGGALMAARQAVGQYLVYARPRQRALGAAGVIAGSACVRVVRARRRGRRGPGRADDTGDGV